MNHFPIVSLARSLSFLVSLSNRVCIIKKRKKKNIRIIGKEIKWRKEISFQILYNRNIKNIRNSFTTSKETIDLPEILQIENSTKLLKSIFEEGNPVHRDTIAPRYIFNGYIFR